MCLVEQCRKQVNAGFPFPHRCWGVVLLLVALVTGADRVSAQLFHFQPERPTLDRWMYPFDFEPGTKSYAPTYGSFDPRFDTRDAQFLLGWDTAGLIATNAGPARYLLRSVRVTVTTMAPFPPNLPFVYDPTHDAFPTYLTNQPGFVPDSDPGRPIELFGAGFRNDWTPATFLETSSYGSLGAISSGTISIGTRNVFAAMFDTNGLLADIANNVGQRNAGWTNAPFEVQPWAVGTTTNAAPGADMPDGGKMVFDVDLSDPLIVSYLQKSLDEGRLRLFISSLSPAGQSTPGGTGIGGVGAYPRWATKENAAFYDPPKIDLEGVVLSEADTDADGLPDDWENFWFGDLKAEAAGDPDGDGATNLAEWRAGTHPTEATSTFRVLEVQWADGGVGSVRFTFAAGRAYSIETTTDFAVWTTWAGSLTYPERGVALWQGAAKPEAGAGALFLRVRAL